MPTPSAPGPPSPYIFSSTCPDTDDSSPPRHDAHINLPAQPIQHHFAMTDEDSPAAARSPPEQTAPRPPHPDTSHEHVHDAEMTDNSSPTGDTSSYLESQHKSADDIDIERTDSPCDTSSSSIEPLRTSRPRSGVGSPTESAYARENRATTKHESPHAEYSMEQDYSLPSMGRDFPSRRVCTILRETLHLHRQVLKRKEIGELTIACR